MRGLTIALLLATAGCASTPDAPLTRVTDAAIASSLGVRANPQIDYAGFTKLTRELETYRAQRRVSLAEFKRMARDRDTLILDARSPAAYARGHIKGAVNAPFTDFTAAYLKQAIGDPNRRILIYCNNNFSNDAQPVMMKSAPLALNIPTFINLYGYGYRNIYELGDVVDFTDPTVEWMTNKS